ncbi:MAG: glycosyltransferase family 2 protein [Acidimicrobiales bacterium]
MANTVGQPGVSVIIPIFNSCSTIMEQLDALTQQTDYPSFEIILADNGSSDGGPAMVRSRPLCGVRVIDASQRRGAVFARNRGVDTARGSLILFCDADDVVCQGWVAALVGALSEFDLVGGGFDVASLNADIAAWRPRPATAAVLDAKPLPFASSANFGIRRTVFTALGGWRSEGAEDRDLCWRAQLAGYSLGFVPGAVVRVRYRRKLTGLAEQAYRYGRAGERVKSRFPMLEHAEVTPWWRLIAWLVLNAPLLARRRTRGMWVYAIAHKCGVMVSRRKVLRLILGKPSHGGRARSEATGHIGRRERRGERLGP